MTARLIKVRLTRFLKALDLKVLPYVGVVRRLLRELHLRGIITEDLALPEDMEGLEANYRGLCRRDESSKRRRIGKLFASLVIRFCLLMSRCRYSCGPVGIKGGGLNLLHGGSVC